MKKLIILGIALLSMHAYSQVIIGDTTGTAGTKTSVLLEFANQGNKGLVLPYVRTKPSNPVPGTIILDASTSTDARVKLYNTDGLDSGWTDLSGQGANLTSTLSTQPTGIVEIGKAVIGAEDSTADGVLVLESTTKAMVLPFVEDVQHVPSPAPGMMVYVNKAGAKRLAVFNGSKWSFWAPSE